MFKFFEKRNSEIEKKYISKYEIKEYRDKTIKYMLENGATENDLKLLTDELIKTSINNNYHPEDTAIALLL